MDVFRKPDAVPEIVEEAIGVGAKAVWMQEGIAHNAAADRAAARRGLKCGDEQVRAEGAFADALSEKVSDCLLRWPLTQTAASSPLFSRVSQKRAGPEPSQAERVSAKRAAKRMVGVIRHQL